MLKMITTDGTEIWPVYNILTGWITGMYLSLQYSHHMYSLWHYVQSLLKINVTFNLSGILSVIQFFELSETELETKLHCVLFPGSQWFCRNSSGTLAALHSQLCGLRRSLAANCSHARQQTDNHNHKAAVSCDSDCLAFCHIQTAIYRPTHALILLLRPFHLSELESRLATNSTPQ